MPPELEERVMDYTKKKLSAKRFKHVERVVATIEEIAAARQLPVADCRMIGWLHDCAKEEPRNVFLSLVHRGLIYVDRETMEQPSLWHGFHAAHIGRKVFGIDNQALLEAVSYHPTGAPGLSAEGLALFVADYAEPGRPMAWTREIREQACQNLVAAAKRVCQEKIYYVLKKGKKLHSRSIDFLKSLSVEGETLPDFSGGHGKNGISDDPGEGTGRER